MGNSYSAEVWLDERRWDALEAALEEQGTNIEKYLQDYLVDLYREMVPADQVREIESCIKQERQEELREAEARKVFSVFRLWDGGKSRCLATEYPKEFLDVARLLRKCLQEGDGGTDAFARKIYGGYEISLERFNELTQERLENTGRIAGVFELEKLSVPGCKHRCLPSVPQGAQLSGGALAEICVPAGGKRAD